MGVIGAIIIVVVLLVIWGFIGAGQGKAADIVNIISWALRKLWPIIALVFVAAIVLTSIGAI